MINLRSATALIFSLALMACSAEDKSKNLMEVRQEPGAAPTAKIEKTDAEWKKELTPEQYEILRKSGTERSHGTVYKQFKEQGAGSYHCAGCNALLFSSKEKFDSGCGWPSFYDPAKAENVKLKKDITMGMARTEVVCAVCGGHLGHVFEGEGFDTPTDQRYCINGGGLVFVPNKKADEAD
jgi:peptide-methionine (R)-S-oxide reductase